METKTGMDLSPDEIEACLLVLKEGCAVDADIAEEQLPRAVRVAIVRDGEHIVAVGAIKQQRPRYAEGIANKSGFPFDPKMHELGYVAVLKANRGGQNGPIVDSLLK